MLDEVNYVSSELLKKQKRSLRNWKIRLWSWNLNHRGRTSKFNEALLDIVRIVGRPKYTGLGLKLMMQWKGKMHNFREDHFDDWFYNYSWHLMWIIRILLLLAFINALNLLCSGRQCNTGRKQKERWKSLKRGWEIRILHAIKWLIENPAMSVF